MAYKFSLQETSFHVVYGRDPPTIRSYEPGETRVATIMRDMEEHEAFLTNMRYRLEQAQAIQKRHYDKQHRPISYEVGNCALLRLCQRAPSSLPQSTTGKLKARFLRPYHVVELINDAVVRLELPP
ncbi:uncharacterized protein [Miscanthus floridulus]|uniref:uncharacterized protein n=1 Tax=Miscanthus floridulus TaxID=154761 RepID=UPI003458F828